MTVQGTPYYMSPEVCQSRPYTYQSDIWALGCILYELCTLKHAFEADNLLGLVFKIVQDPHQPIVEDYSDGLKELIDLCLIKDETKRPNIIDIIRRPFVKEHMQKFINTGGKINLSQNVSKKRSIQPEEAMKMNQLKEKDISTLNHRQREQLRKEQLTILEFERMKNAAVENLQQNMNFAKNMKQREFHGGQSNISN